MQNFNKIPCFAVFFSSLILTSCSLDPRAGDLSMRISVADGSHTGSRPEAILAQKHCCMIELNGEMITVSAPIKKTGDIGSVTADIPTYFTVGQTVNLELSCGNVNGTPSNTQIDDCNDGLDYDLPSFSSYRFDPFTIDGRDHEFDINTGAR